MGLGYVKPRSTDVEVREMKTKEVEIPSKSVDVN